MKNTSMRNVAAIIALLLLAFTASYGVYTFQLLFVPWYIALASAASFEATYIGLALALITTANRKRAAIISIAAVVVSITYNSVSALFHLDPTLLQQTTLWLNSMLAILHGMPLALVAYCVADLIIHQQQIAKQTPSNIVSKDTSKPVANVLANDGAKVRASSKAKYFCSICNYKAKSAKALNGHMTKHRKI